MNLNITAQQVELTDDIKKYVNKKFTKLNRYLPRYAKNPAHVEVILKHQKGRKANPFSCEAVLTLPHEKIAVEEATVNIFAAIDIVEAKLKNSIRKYKDKHARPRYDKKKVLSRFRKLADREFWGRQN